MRIAFILGFCGVFLGNAALAAPRHDYSKDQIEAMRLHNRSLRGVQSRSTPAAVVERPYAEYEKARYLLFSSQNSFYSGEVKTTLAKFLPADMILVIFYTSPSEYQRLKDEYEPIVGPSRLRILKISTNPFWARDALPVPVFLPGNKLAGVDAKYGQGNEPDTELAHYFRMPLMKHTYYYEGGNFLADSKGNCLIVNNSRTSQIPDSNFITQYGCKKLTRFPHKSGIGHVDERIKLLSDSVALTDTPEYQSTLEGLGYEVQLLPKPGGAYETYVNALLVNGTLFMPSYGKTSDEAARKIYQDAGLDVIPANTSSLSNSGLGSIHCITMTYPPVSTRELEDILGVDESSLAYSGSTSTSVPTSGTESSM